MAVIGEAEIAVKANTKGFGPGLEKGVKSALGGIAKLGAGAGLALGGTIAVGVGSALGEFKDFEAGINEVFTLLGEGADTGTLDAIEDQVKNLSTKFGLELPDAISGAYDAISAGVDTSNFAEFEGFTENAAKFAAAGATDFGTSIDLLTTATNAFSLDANDAERTADILFTTIKGGKTTADQLAASLFNVAPVAAAAGVSLEETSAGLATLTAQGVPTAAAATQLKGAFSELSKSGTVADKAFRELSGQGFASFLEGGGTVQQAFNMMREAADEGGFAVTDMFGSIEAGAAVLGTTGAQADRFAGNLAAIEDGAGATNAAFETMDGGIQKSFDRIGATFRVGLVDIGDGLSPLVRTFTDVFEGKFPDIVDGFVSGVLGIADNVGPAFAAVGEMFEGALGNIGTGAGGGEGFGQLFDKIKDAAVELMPTIKTLGESIGTILGAQAGATKDIFLAILPVMTDLATTVLPPLATLLAQAATAFGSLVSAAPPGVLTAVAGGFIAINAAMKVNAALTRGAELISYIKKLPALIKGTQLWAAAQKVLNASLLTNPIFLVGAALVAIGAALVVAYKNSETFRNFVDGLADSLKGKLMPAFDAIKGAVDTVVGVFQNLFAFFTGDDLGSMAAGLNAGAVIADVFGVSMLGVVETLAKLKQVFTGVADIAKNLFSGDFSAAFDGLKEIGPVIGELLLGAGKLAGEKLIDGLKLLGPLIPPAMKTVGGLILKGLVAAISTGVPLLGKGLQLIGKYLVKGVTIIAPFLLDLGKGLLELLGKGLEAGADAVGLGGVFDAVAGVIGVAWDLITGAVEIGIATVGVAIGAAKDIWDTGALQLIFDGVKLYFEVVWAVIKTAVEVGIAAVGFAIDAAQALWNTGVLQTIFEGLKLYIETVWTAISFAIETAISFVGGLIAGAQAIWNTGALQAIFDVVAAAFGIAWDIITALISTAVDLIRTHLSYFETGIGFLSTVWDGIKTAIGVAWDAISTVIGANIDAISTGIDVFITVIETVVDAFQFVWDEIVRIWDAISTFFSTTFEALKTFFTETFNAIKDFVVDQFLTPVKDKFEEIWNAIKTKVVDIAQGIKDEVTEKFDLLKAAVLKVVDAVKTELDTRWSNIKTNLTNWGQKIWDAVEEKFNSLKTALNTVVDGIKTALSTRFETLKTTLTTKAEAIKEAVKKPFNALKTFLTGLLSVSLGSLNVGGITGPLQTVIDKAGDAIALLGKVPGAGLVSGVVGGAKNLLLAQGGFVSGATQAIVGEDGQELVLPLTKTKRMTQLLSQAFRFPNFQKAVASVTPNSGKLTPFKSISAVSNFSRGGSSKVSNPTIEKTATNKPQGVGTSLDLVGFVETFKSSLDGVSNGLVNTFDREVASFTPVFDSALGTLGDETTNTFRANVGESTTAFQLGVDSSGQAFQSHVDLSSGAFQSHVDLSSGAFQSQVDSSGQAFQSNIDASGQTLSTGMVDFLNTFQQALTVIQNSFTSTFSAALNQTEQTLNSAVQQASWSISNAISSTASAFTKTASSGFTPSGVQAIARAVAPTISSAIGNRTATPIPTIPDGFGQAIGDRIATPITAISNTQANAIKRAEIDARAAAQRAVSNFSRSTDNSTTTINFNGAEASEIAKTAIQKDQSIVQGLRVRS